MFQQYATPNWQVDAPEFIHEAFAYNYSSTTSTRQVVVGGLRYSGTKKVNNFLWLTNFRVLWDAPVKDDPWDLWLIMIISFQSAVGCTCVEDPGGSKARKASYLV